LRSRSQKTLADGEFMNVHRRCFLLSSAAALGAKLLRPDLARAAQRNMAGSDAGSVSNDLDCVQPMIGTGWRGHTYPGATAPFGLVQLSPDTSGHPGPRWNARGDYSDWERCSGYHYADDVILGFSHTHVQGTGGKDLGDVLVMPLIEGRNWSWESGAPPAQAEMQREALGEDSGWVYAKGVPGYRSYFSHERESASAGYYEVFLETPRVRAELTATTHCGMHRYEYERDERGKRGILIDLQHGLGSRAYALEMTIETDQQIIGRRVTNGWARDREIYFVLEFSAAPESIELRVDGQMLPGEAGKKYEGKNLQAIWNYGTKTSGIVLRVGISGVSVEGARKNLTQEIKSWNFDEVHSSTKNAWRKALSFAETKFPEHTQKEIFYTGAYHGLTAPMTYSDVDGSYRGQDRANHQADFTKYTTLSIWDIYRGEFPFLMLAQPQRCNDIVRTLLADYEQLGQEVLPMWTLWGNETWSMNGFHAAGMIVGAYARGYRGFDAELAYQAIRKTALVGTEVKGNREMQRCFRELGYVPSDTHNGAVSCTLDLAYDNWCSGAMAELLGKRSDAEMFYALSKNYRNLYDASTGFMRGKNSDGKWREPFRPDEEYEEDYVESDAWQASFQTPHDVAGLIALHGGDAAFIAKLEALFTAPSLVGNVRPDVTGMTGQNAQGNEPSNLHPYLFSFAGAPWKTQYWVRRVASLYRNTPVGIPGNDDCGQLSSWYVFAALGFYPVNAATGVYVLGSPLVREAVLTNPLNGVTFTIVAENNSASNLYIESATLNGRPLRRSWISHAEIVAGGCLRLRMSSEPNQSWGAAPEDRPPSGLIGN
jgi:predicted alpha-1,2-mannosidase